MKSNLFIFALLISIMAISCGEEQKQEADLYETETMNSGRLAVYCDDMIYPLMDTTFDMYRNMYPRVHLTDTAVSSRAAMSHLFSGEARVVVVAREYLSDEEKLMREYKVDEHQKFLLATDALTFFTPNEFSSPDTLSAEEVYKELTNPDFKISENHPEWDSDPEFVTTDVNSSVYSNIMLKAAKGDTIRKAMKIFQTLDSVRNYVSSAPGRMGILYLTHVIRDTSYKKIRMGFTVDTTGERIYPQIVHPGYVVQGKYPYPVNYYAYLLEDRRNLPFWFASYIGKEKKVQNYYNNRGLVAGFAKYHLITED
ncbi:MAG: substrate-binding domain-containing protein [Candidatus Kapaibacterium sp.]